MDAEVIDFPPRPGHSQPGHNRPGHEEPPSAEPVARRRGRAGGSILMAAMIGLADALGLDEDRKDEIAVVADSPTGEGGLVLMFGPLEPLE